MSYVFVDITANRVERHHNGLQLAEMTAPVTPASGWGHLYAKSDGKIYWKNDAGTETDLVAGGAGAVTSVSGTANRITSSGGATPVIDIAATYVGQTSITTLGTVSTGVWSATAIARNKIAALTANKALVTDASGFDTTSATTDTEIGYVSGVTSAIQTQLNKKGFTIVITGSQATIADATNYYSGAVQNNSGATADINRIYIPIACTLVAGYGFIVNAGTLGTGESGTFYARKNNTTDITISESVTTNATANTFNGTGLAGSFAAGDYVEAKWLTPTYATNPSQCRWVLTLYFIPT